MKTCSVPQCKKKERCKGLCENHYRQSLRREKRRTTPRKKTEDGEPFRFLLKAFVQPETTDCIDWPYGTVGRGYGGLTFFGVRYNASRLMCEFVHGPPPTPKHEAAHSCGRGHFGCIQPGHLRWATTAENHADKLGHGTDNRGEKHGLARLTEAQVHHIRRLGGSMPQTKIAEIVGASRGQVQRVLSKECWGWLPEQALNDEQGDR